MAIDRTRLKYLAKEFGRYLVVGGTSALLDWGTLYLSYNCIFNSSGTWQLMLSTAVGFIAGIILNYVLSLIWVFKSAKENNRGKTVGAFLIFVIIGVIGLLLTMAGMYSGCMLVGVNEYIARLFVAGAVTVWNYAARKIFIFKDDKKAWTEKQQSSSERGPQD